MNNAIYTAVDGNYENYTRACFNSIKQNYPSHPTVLVYADGISDEFRSYINGLENFEIREHRNNLNHDNLGPVGNSIVYQKYMIWDECEFSDYDIVLHLDCDTIVLAPLDDLFTNQFLIFDNDERSKDFSMFKVSGEHNFYETMKICGNAGVFAVPKRYRTAKNFAKLNNLTVKYENEILYADQSIINLWCREEGIPISKDVRYNFQPQFFSYPDCEYLLDDVKILHFAARKPDSVEFLLWWRVKNGLSVLLNDMYKQYLTGEYNET